MKVSKVSKLKQILLSMIKRILHLPLTLAQVFLTGITFTFIVIFYSVILLLRALFPSNRVWAKPFNTFNSKLEQSYQKIVKVLSRKDDQSANLAYFIEISFRNMQVQKTRTAVTVFGMGISISFIVFLISVGYGLQDLVTSRVARLEELQQTEVMPGLSDDLTLNDEVLARLNDMQHVDQALPLISVVGRVTYQESVSDIAIYGTTTEYLTSSAIKPLYGDIFDSNELSRTVYPEEKLKVELNKDQKSSIPSVGHEIGELTFSIAKDSWLRVRSGVRNEENVIGFTRRTDQTQSGIELYGESFEGFAGDQVKDPTGQLLGVWIKSKFPLWSNTECVSEASKQSGNSDLIVDVECTDGQYIPIRDSDGNQIVEEGYIAKLIGRTEDITETAPVVLGVESLISSTLPGQLPLVEDEFLTDIPVNENVKVIELPEGSLREAVVNRSVLSLLGIPESEGVGKKLTLTFVAVGDLVGGDNQRVESAPTEYTIVGVTPEENTPVIYVPFIELRALGIDRFSQIKVIADDPGRLRDIRTGVESLGFGTVSVADTVEQIDSLFSTFRLLLAVIGLVALSVAALGMFNTLTVSLLERTREVGLMKAMGMKNVEVRELFLTESMIMGFYGGLIGILLGFGAGKVLSAVLSSVAVARGVGIVDISVLPWDFVLVVVVISIIVGLLTGYFPARRATKISALNALRYE